MIEFFLTTMRYLLSLNSFPQINTHKLIQYYNVCYTHSNYLAFISYIVLCDVLSLHLICTIVLPVRIRVIADIVIYMCFVLQVQERVAFGKPLSEQSSMEQHVARSRAALEQSRLLVLKTAHMMDTVGNRVRSLLLLVVYNYYSSFSFYHQGSPKLIFHLTYNANNV